MTILLLLLIISVVCFIGCTTRADAHEQEQPAQPFAIGDEVMLECQSATNSTEWISPFTCVENGKPLTFEFGVDKFMYCGWLLATSEQFEYAAALVSQQRAMLCRIPFSKDHKDKHFYVPLNLAFWGMVEPTHFHINYHMNWIFHADEGRIIGTSVYPVQDRFQFVRPGSVITLHGPVRWFHGHSFNNINLPANAYGTIITASATDHSAVVASAFSIFLTMVISVASTLLGVTLLYTYQLRPALIKKYLKAE